MPERTLAGRRLPHQPPRGSVALVSGASSGIGLAIALRLAREGFGVGLIGLDEHRLRQGLHQVEAAGGRGLSLVADVTDQPSVAQAVRAAESSLGPVSLLVNAAGQIERAEVPVWDADPDEWWQVVETNLRGSFLLVRAVVPSMLVGGGGRVVNLSSGLGARDAAVYSAYAASKAGLFRLSGALHAAGYDRGLRAFEIAPGVVQTPMTAGMPIHRGRESWTPVDRVTDLVAAVATGDLDAWSGRFLRADRDTPASLVAAERNGDLTAAGRRLAVRPYGPDDPLAT